MDALLAYHSSDSEDETEFQPKSGPLQKRGKQVDSTSILPKPDLNFEFSGRKFQKKTSDEGNMHPRLPWSNPHKRDKMYQYQLDKGRNVGPGIRNMDQFQNMHTLSVSSRSEDHGHMDLADQVQLGDLDCQDKVHGLNSGRLQWGTNNIRHVIHPQKFGPQNLAWVDAESQSSLHSASTASVGAVSNSRDRPFRGISGGTGLISATTKRAAVTQPYVPKRLRQAPHEPSRTGINTHAGSSQSKFIEPMYTTQPMIAYQMDRHQTSKLPRCRTLEFHLHSGPATHIRWCLPQFSHLLLSSSMDKTIRVWNGISKDGCCLQTLNCHTGGVKDAQWGSGGHSVLSCGFDKTARLCDVESGKELQVFDHPSYATCMKTKPDDPSVFICGTYNSSIFCWDTRTGNIEHEYKGKLGQILDLEFLPGCSEFASSCDIVSRDSANRTIMVWDLRTTAVVSNQLYHEKYTCPCLKSHPSDSVFVAQSTANYIALFSTVRPYKLNKFKRYDGHQLEGYHIGCDFSPDGALLISGSSNGKVYVYDYRTTRILKTLQCCTGPCIDVAWHPVLPGVIASCSWDGSVEVWH